jgi:hypothetical protein
MEDSSKDILERYGEKKKDVYGRIKKELKEVQQAICLVHVVPTAPSMPSSSQTVELGDEPAQLRRMSYATRSSVPESPGREGEGYIIFETGER